LLSPAEQAFFQRLAVFAGGCSFEAAEAICHADEPAFDTLDGITALIDKSLLRQEQTPAGESRFVMFETIREFALERLQASDDWQAIRRRHADFFLALAEQAEPELTGSKQGMWLNILEREHDNLRAVFSWIEETAQADYGLRLSAAIWRFWLVRGHEDEGRERLLVVLALPGAEKPTRARAKALNAVGTLMHGSGDYSTAARLHLEESLEISRKLGDKQGVATVINNLGWIAAQLGELDAAEKLSQESLALHTELGDQRGRAVAFNNLAWTAYAQSEFALAYSLQEKNLSLRQEIGDERGVAFAMAWLAWIDIVRGNHDQAASLLDSAIRKLQELGDNMIMGFAMWILAQMAVDQGDFARAGKLMEENPTLLKERDPHMLWLLALVKQHDGDEQQAQALLEESISKFRAREYKWGIALALYYIGRQASDRNDYKAAAACFHESMVLNRDLGNKLGMAKALVGFGDLALAEGDPARSARLFAAAEALYQTIGAVIPPYERTRFDREAARVASLLAEETFATAWKAGQKMTTEQAVSYALKRL
jgi:tetratricopeptide (TPR) repeat protein